MWKAYALFSVFVSSGGAAQADVFEFKGDGSVVSHVAKDYRQKYSLLYASLTSQNANTLKIPKMPQMAKARFQSYINAAAQKYGVEVRLIEAVILAESDFNPLATSHKGAMGLMQLMPKTAIELGVSDAYDPEQNIDGGVKYLKGLLDLYKGDRRLALAAYNAGRGTVTKYNGIPPYPKTINYVRVIEALLMS